MEEGEVTLRMARAALQVNFRAVATRPTLLKEGQNT